MYLKWSWDRFSKISIRKFHSTPKNDIRIVICQLLFKMCFKSVENFSCTNNITNCPGAWCWLKSSWISSNDFKLFHNIETFPKDQHSQCQRCSFSCPTLRRSFWLQTNRLARYWEEKAEMKLSLNLRIGQVGQLQQKLWLTYHIVSKNVFKNFATDSG